MQTQETRWERLVWWLGVPVALVGATVGPYWIRALVLGHAHWFRIPLVGDAMFDTSAYLQPMGHAAAGLLPEAALIGSFAFIIRALAALLPDLSNAELWLVSRWAFGVLSVWIGAWTVHQWSGLERRGARWVSAMFWVSVALVIGMKPGLFSWFLPMGLFGAGVVPIVARALEERRTAQALCWSLCAAAVTAVYTWYALFTLLWLGAVWGAWIARRTTVRGTAVAFTVITVAGLLIAGGAAALASLTEAGRMAFEMANRFSLSHTRMPFVSGSVLLTMAWILLLIPVAQRAVGGLARRLEYAWTAWVVILLGFWHSPFTGAFIQNDHFRSLAVICSWLSLALLWNATRSPDMRPQRVSWVTTLMLAACLALSGFFTVKILLAPYAWNGDLLNVIQLAHWFALFLASLLIIRWMWARPPLRPSRFGALIGLGALVIGGMGWSAALNREFSEMSAIEPWTPLFRWVDEHVPAHAALCTNHGGQGFNLDDQISAITGRVVHFSNSTQYHREGNAAFMRSLYAVAGFFDAHTAVGSAELLQELSSFNQGLVCVQFPLHERLLRSLGFSQDRIDRVIGCPRESLEARWASLANALAQKKGDAQAFKATCPYVVIPDHAKALWRLPEGYVETRVMDHVSVWSITPSQQDE